MMTRFKAHGTFYIRRGWLPKGMRQVSLDSTVFSKDKGLKVFGLGSNQVPALRYWLQSSGLIEQEGRNGFALSRLGKIIQEHDPYLEEIGTLAFIHYKIASGEALDNSFATSWYYLFNEFTMQEFTQEDFVQSLVSTLKYRNIKLPAEGSIASDFDCIKNTYSNDKKDKVDFEDNKECPLIELGLLQLIDPKKKTYKKSQIRNSIPLFILLAVIAAENKGESEIKIQNLLTKPNSIGMIFNLDSISLADYLDKMHERGYLQVIRTAGLDIVKFEDMRTCEEYLLEYYNELSIREGGAR